MKMKDEVDFVAIVEAELANDNVLPDLVKQRMIAIARGIKVIRETPQHPPPRK